MKHARGLDINCLRIMHQRKKQISRVVTKNYNLIKESKTSFRILITTFTGLSFSSGQEMTGQASQGMRRIYIYFYDAHSLLRNGNVECNGLFGKRGVQTVECMASPSMKCTDWPQSIFEGDKPKQVTLHDESNLSRDLMSVVCQVLFYLDTE